MIDNGIVIEKAIWKIADEYGLDVDVVENAITFSETPLDLDSLVGEGIFCFRGPNDNVKYSNAAICLSNKILANVGVAKNMLSILSEQIRQWDHEDINVLLSLLNKLITIMELNPDEYHCLRTSCINFKALPSEPVPEDIAEKYSVWSMDKKGMCLVGIDANEVVHIDDLDKI
ncbi:hypothetical protein [Methanolobus profundi]|uniref:Uncharacterized protein n=1 Tax=Methanolobus profundi TaxID=487685 RepID=A0A1I4S307_9EURY|nr:hypothetical protein [Methanolobus profundi]SFM58845.1 hypothetical protein SAMN04488696_1740 [Methanolobus profundi]